MCGVAAVVAVIDLSVVSVALPSIQTELSASDADLQWVVVAYGVMMAGCMLLGGRLGDRVGHRRVLVAGVAVLTGASLLGGLAATLGMLIAAGPGRAWAPHWRMTNSALARRRKYPAASPAWPPDDHDVHGLHLDDAPSVTDPVTKIRLDAGRPREPARAGGRAAHRRSLSTPLRACCRA
jgi:hypothetical protein